MHLVGELLEHSRLGPIDLDRIGALDARERLLDVVLDVLREVEADARHLVGEFLLQFFRQLLLGEIGRPFIERLQRHEQLDVRERRGVAAVVGTAVLRNDGDHLRMAEQDLAHLARRLGAGIERDGRRHLRPDPEIALLQRRQKLAAEPRCREEARQPGIRARSSTATCRLSSAQRSTGRVGLRAAAHDRRSRPPRCASAAAATPAPASP